MLLDSFEQATRGEVRSIVECGDADRPGRIVGAETHRPVVRGQPFLDDASTDRGRGNLVQDARLAETVRYRRRGFSPQECPGVRKDGNHDERAPGDLAK